MVLLVCCLKGSEWFLWVKWPQRELTLVFLEFLLCVRDARRSDKPRSLFVCVSVLHPQEKYECALRRASIKIVTPDWVLDCISEKTRKDEALYHPRLIVYEEEEEEEEEEEGAGNEEPDSPNEGSTDGKSSPASSQEGSPSGEPPFSPKSSAEKSKGELMFDDSSDSSPEKQERNLNWTPAEVPQLAAAKRRLPPGTEPGLINLCANVPPVPGGILPPEVGGSLLAPGQSLQGPERPEVMAAWSPAMRTLRNITNNADIQQMSSRPSNVAHVSHSSRDRNVNVRFQSS